MQRIGGGFKKKWRRKFLFVPFPQKMEGKDAPFFCPRCSGEPKKRYNKKRLLREVTFFCVESGEYDVAIQRGKKAPLQKKKKEGRNSIDETY